MIYKTKKEGSGFLSLWVDGVWCTTGTPDEIKEYKILMGELRESKGLVFGIAKDRRKPVSKPSTGGKAPARLREFDIKIDRRRSK